MISRTNVFVNYNNHLIQALTSHMHFSLLPINFRTRSSRIMLFPKHHSYKHQDEKFHNENNWKAGITEITTKLIFLKNTLPSQPHNSLKIKKLKKNCSFFKKTSQIIQIRVT